MNLTDELLDAGFGLLYATSFRLVLQRLYSECLYDFIDQNSQPSMILLGLCEQFEKGDGAAANVKTHKH